MTRYHFSSALIALALGACTDVTMNDEPNASSSADAATALEDTLEPIGDTAAEERSLSEDSGVPQTDAIDAELSDAPPLADSGAHQADTEGEAEGLIDAEAESDAAEASDDAEGSDDATSGPGEGDVLEPEAMDAAGEDTSGDEEDIGVPACVPQCEGMACGDDGCGGSCGACQQGESCQGGACTGCTPACDGKACGDDGCGGSCGACQQGESCDAGQCACTPQCEGKACGDDGCGGSCGGCDDQNPCTVDYCSAAQSCEATEMALMPCPSPPCAVNNQCLYDIPREGLSGTERMAAISAQGVLAQHRPAIWLGGGQAMPLHRARLVSDFGVNFVEESSLWSLLERFTDALSGYVLYEPNTSSQSVAFSLSGVLGTVAISPDLEAQAQAAGLALVEDVRGLDEAWCWENYAGQFSDHMLAEQLESVGHAEWLMDWPISQRAFIYFDETCGDLRTELAQQLDQPLIYGWGAECGEYEFAKGASEGGASVVASDYSSNLSVLARVEGAPVTGNTSVGDPQVEEGVHYVAFLMSDGDNIQFLQNAFDHERWWGSPERGSFEMNWEVSPVLPQVAPTILTWLYESASDKDSVVAGPSGFGYAFPSLHTDALGFAAATGNAMAESDMRIVTVLDSQGDLAAGDAFVAQPNISGVIYKDFADYNALGQKLRWAYGKPIMSIQYLLWNNGAYEDSPQGVAASLNSAPQNPSVDIRSYSIVNAHAWSEWPESPKGTGAMGAVAWTVSLLDEHVRVVSAEALFKILSDNLQGVTEGEGAMVFEAESDLQHVMGYPDGEGWACNTADQEPGHMCYGPYTSTIEPGERVAEFEMMVDVNGPPAVNNAVATIDVFDSQAQTILASRELSRYEFNQPMSYQSFGLPFTNPEGSVLEFRVYWHATSYVNVDKVRVE